MNTVEDRLGENVPFPRIYCRYVDDCFAIVEAIKSAEIQFTIGMEEDNSLPFFGFTD